MGQPLDHLSRNLPSCCLILLIFLILLVLLILVVLLAFPLIRHRLRVILTHLFLSILLGLYRVDGHDHV